MSEQPLAGVRVLELGGIGPVPFAGMLLADMGADVVQIDRVEPVASSIRTAALTRGKRSIALDLRSAEDAKVAFELAARAHILIEGFRPGVAERLGIGPEQLWRVNPALVYGRMTGWGQAGPWAEVAGHDINYIGLTGALHAIGRAGEAPSVPLILVGDFGGGAMFLITGVLAALRQAEHTGRGQLVDAAIIDGVSRLLTPIQAAAVAGEWIDERGVNLLDSGRPWYDVYATSDGGWMSVGALEDRFYAEFAQLLGLTDEQAQREDPAGWPALREAIAERFASRTRADWEQVFAGTDACVAPVLSLAEAARHPQMLARGTLADRSSPAPAPRFGGIDAQSDNAVSGTGLPASPRVIKAIPRPGEHAREILESWQLDG